MSLRLGLRGDGAGGRGPIEAIFFGPLAPICAYFSALEPVFPVFGASLSPCPPCASLFAEFFIGRPSGRGPTPARGPNVRPWLMRTAILLGIHLNLPMSAVKPGQAQLVLRWVTTWEHWVLYAFYVFAFFRHPPAVHPHTPRHFDSPPPSQTCTHGTCATAYGQAPGSPLPRQPAARDVLSSF